MTHQQTSRSLAGLRGSQDAAAGVFLIIIAGFAAWQGGRLPLGTLRSMGPGMLPMALAVLLAAGGVALVVVGFLKEGEQMESWSARGLLFILGGVVLFALTIQSLGLVVAGPLSMVFGSMASDEFRWKEAFAFSIGLTIVCILLFKTALGLPIPVMTFW